MAGKRLTKLKKRREQGGPERRQKKKRCLFHDALKKFCTCTEENKAVSKTKLKEKVELALEWRRRCVAVNPSMFQQEAREIFEIEALFGN